MISLEDILRTAMCEEKKLKRNIYDLGPELIAKAHDSYSHALIDYTFGNMLYQYGVRVPKVHLFVPPYRWRGRAKPEGADNWHVIMQRINGIDLRDTKGEDRRTGVRMYKKELSKVLDLGIYPCDGDHGCNAMFDEDKKLWLIDFEFYRFGTRRELSQFTKYLRGKIEFK